MPTSLTQRVPGASTSTPGCPPPAGLTVCWNACPAVAFWGFTGLVVAMAVLSDARVVAAAAALQNNADSELSDARVVAALGRAENTNSELEQRVAEKMQRYKPATPPCVKPNFKPSGDRPARKNANA